MKQHRHSILSAALIAAGCLAAGGAAAVTPGAASDTVTPPTTSMQQGSDYGNAADKTQVQPSQEAVQKGANEPSPSVLDDNAQRQHDRNQGSTQRPARDSAGTTHEGQPGAAGTEGNTLRGGMGASGDASGTISRRDWDRIDTNHDNLVTPEEMDAWLQQKRAQGGSTDQQPAPQK